MDAWAAIVTLFREWGPSALAGAAAIAVNRTLSRYDKKMDQVDDHEKRISIVETRCKEREAC